MNDRIQKSGLSLPFARVALILAAIAALGAIAVAVLRSRGSGAESTPPAMQAPVGDVNAAIAGLEKKLAANPDDAKGWHLLGWSYYSVGRYADSARAYSEATKIDPKVAEYWSALGEAQVLSGPGGVTPAAQASFAKALSIEPKDFRSRYFTGVKMDADGDHKGALDLWINMLRESPADAPWQQPVRDLIARVSKANGIDVGNRVPTMTMAPPSPAPEVMPQGSAATDAIPGPSPDQLRAASNLTPSQQDDMAKAMVARLATRLETNPRDPDGWMRLMRARMVMGDPQAARAAMQRAKTVFRRRRGPARADRRGRSRAWHSSPMRLARRGLLAR